jgi:lactoylglutathione lyase
MPFRLTHTRLLVSDFPKCFEFYRDVIGLPVIQEVEGDIYAEFNAGDTILALYHREMMAAVIGTSEKPANAERQDHVVLTFEVADVDATYADLKARGVHFVTEPADQEAWVLRVAHFRDPDGNLIEINAPLKQA